jgi:hypothetical protein
MLDQTVRTALLGPGSTNHEGGWLGFPVGKHGNQNLRGIGPSLKGVYFRPGIQKFYRNLDPLSRHTSTSGSLNTGNNIREKLGVLILSTSYFQPWHCLQSHFL